MTIEPVDTSYSRISPEQRALRARIAQANPTRGQRALELTLFGVFAVTIAVCAIALFAINSRSYKEVPNRFAAGLASGRANVLLISMATIPAADAKSNDEVIVNGITLLSLKPERQQAAAISIPPDLWVRVGRFGAHRLGRADVLGVSSGYPGEGTGLLSDTVASVTGEPVHAVIRIDDETLASTIDALGGVDVVVAKKFYVWNVRKRFGVGVRHLNGERAKWYISPFVGGPQGTPQARERRHQQLMLAMLAKLATAPEPVRARFAKMHHTHEGRLTASTNLSLRDFDQLLGALRSTPAIRQVSLSPALETFEVRAIHDSGQVLRPRGKDYAEVQTIVRGAFEQGQSVALAPALASAATAAQTVLTIEPAASQKSK